MGRTCQELDLLSEDFNWAYEAPRQTALAVKRLFWDTHGQRHPGDITCSEGFSKKYTDDDIMSAFKKPEAYHRKAKAKLKQNSGAFFFAYTTLYLPSYDPKAQLILVFSGS